MKGIVNLFLIAYFSFKLLCTVLHDVFNVSNPYVLPLLYGLAVIVAVTSMTAVIVWTVISLSGVVF